MFKPCRYGCGVTVEVRKEPEGWRPFEESGEMHNCPNSPYNQKKKENGPIPAPLEPQKEAQKSTAKIRAPISLVKIISSLTINELENQYDRVVNAFISNGAKVQGCQYQKDGDVYTICVYYEVPNTTVGEVGK